MATEITCADTRRKEAGETVNVALDFTDVLDSDNSIGETISSVTSVAVTGLTITNAAATSVVRKINGRSVEAGKAITFTVAGGTNGTTYQIKAIVVTSGGQTRIRFCPMEVSAS